MPSTHEHANRVQKFDRVATPRRANDEITVEPAAVGVSFALDATDAPAGALYEHAPGIVEHQRAVAARQGHEGQSRLPRPVDGER